MKFLLNFDGGTLGNSNPGTAIRYGYVIINKENGEILEQASGRKEGLPSIENTNNVAEWTALLTALHSICKMGFSLEVLSIIGDSQLILNQLSGKWKVKSPHLKKYYEEAKALLAELNIETVDIQWIPREKNSEADSLSRKG